MHSRQGQLLVASPHLMHSDFARTVILMLHDADDGAMGVVLNRPAGETVRSLWSKFSRQPTAAQHDIHLGGPVAGPVMVLHHGAAGSGAASTGAAIIAPAPALLQQLLQRDGLQSGRERLRVFVGHAEWTQSQLERELQAGAWLVTPATVDLVFGDDDLLWPKAVRQVGRSILCDSLAIKHIPDDPSVN